MFARLFSLNTLLPLLAGMGLAYFLTGLVDGPAAMHFQTNDPFGAPQTEVARTADQTVLRKNILKLGTPLSMTLLPDATQSGGHADMVNRFSPAQPEDGKTWKVRGRAAPPAP